MLFVVGVMAVVVAAALMRLSQPEYPAGAVPSEAVAELAQARRQRRTDLRGLRGRAGDAPASAASPAAVTPAVATAAVAPAPEVVIPSPRVAGVDLVLLTTRQAMAPWSNVPDVLEVPDTPAAEAEGQVCDEVSGDHVPELPEPLEPLEPADFLDPFEFEAGTGELQHEVVVLDPRFVQELEERTDAADAADAADHGVIGLVELEATSEPATSEDSTEVPLFADEATIQDDEAWERLVGMLRPTEHAVDGARPRTAASGTAVLVEAAPVAKSQGTLSLVPEPRGQVDLPGTTSATSATSASSATKVRRCGVCREPGHDRRRCPVAHAS